MLTKILLLFLFSFEVLAITLSNSYYTSSRNIKLQDIVPNASYDVTLFKIDGNKYTKKVKAKKVITLLEKHGFENIQSSTNYIQFTKRSPIDTSKIKAYIRNLYQEKYPSININAITIQPRGYITHIPKEYEVFMQKKSHLSYDGTLSIKTLDKKRIFFNYIVDAKIDIYQSKKTIGRNQKISLFNTVKKNIQFDKFRAMPINSKHMNTTQSKRKLKVDSIITLRDVETLNLVKKGSNVSVTFNDKNINISFAAKALQNGKLNDIISVQKRNKKRLKVRVVAQNRVEINSLE